MADPESVEPPESLVAPAAESAPETDSDFPLTNVVQRFRGAQDPVALIRQRQAEQEDALTGLMRRDHDARDLYWRGQQLDLDHAAHASRMRTEDEHFRHLAELHPLQLARAEATAATARAEAKGRESAAHLKAETARLASEHTSGFQLKMLDAIRNGAVPRTEAFRQLLLTGRMEHPWMDTTSYGDFWKAHSGSSDDPEQAARDFQLALAAPSLPEAVNAAEARPASPVHPSGRPRVRAGLQVPLPQSSNGESARPRPAINLPRLELTPEQRTQIEEAVKDAGMVGTFDRDGSLTLRVMPRVDLTEEEAAEERRQWVESLLNEPLISLPKPENTGAFSGALRGAIKGVEGLETKQNLALLAATLALPKPLQKLIATGFTGLMLKDSPTLIVETLRSDGTAAQKTEGVAQSAVGGLLGLWALKEMGGRPGEGGSTLQARIAEKAARVPDFELRIAAADPGFKQSAPETHAVVLEELQRRNLTPLPAEEIVRAPEEPPRSPEPAGKTFAINFPESETTPSGQNAAEPVPAPEKVLYPKEKPSAGKPARSELPSRSEEAESRLKEQTPPESEVSGANEPPREPEENLVEESPVESRVAPPLDEDRSGLENTVETHPAVGRDGDWGTLGLPSSKEFPAIPRPARMSREEAMQKLSTPYAVEDPLGYVIGFGSRLRQHFEEHRDGRRPEFLPHIEATVRDPIEIWSENTDKGPRLKHIAAFTASDGTKVFAVVSHQVGETTATIITGTPKDHPSLNKMRKGKLLYLRPRR